MEREMGMSWKQQDSCCTGPKFKTRSIIIYQYIIYWPSRIPFNTRQNIFYLIFFLRMLRYQFNIFAIYIIIMRIFIIAILFIILAIAASQSTGEQQATPKHFLVEAKVIIEGKPYNPTNISLSISNASNPSYSFNLSAVNFNKNVTVSLRLFSWYNAQWVLSRQTISLKITDKRNVYRESSHLFARLMKYNSRKYEAKMIDEKQPTLLNFTEVLVSYDPESSLLVSRLEDPEIFTEQHNYLPLADMDKQMKNKAIKINITFGVVTRSDAFINSKNHIVSLNEVSNKIKQKIPLITRPIGDNIDPLLIYRTLLANYDAIKRANKQYSEKIAIIQGKKYGGLLTPRLHRFPFNIPSQVLDVAKKSNVTLTDTFVPTFYFILQQGFMLDTINSLQDYIKKNLDDKADRDWMSLISQWAQIQVIVSFAVAALWVLLDVFEYGRIKNNPGLSLSYGYFVVAWLLLEIVNFSIRIGSTLNQYWGIGSFFFFLLLLKLFVSPLQRKFNRYSHKALSFDKAITEGCFNILMFAVLANAVRHLFIENDITNGELAIWSLSQLQLLLNEYYYFFAMLPPLLLSLKLKSTAHIGWARILFFLIIALKDDYWLLIDTHWALLALKLKQQTVLVLILILKIVLGNRKIEIIEVEPQIQEKIAQMVVDQQSKTNQKTEPSILKTD